jgi:hypothetical protein
MTLGTRTFLPYTLSMHCPRCSFEQADSGAECLSCGIVFAKWSGESRRQELPTRSPLPALRPIDHDVANGQFGRRELVILASGLAAAILAHQIPIARTAFSALTTLFHEIGHAVVAWTLARPAIPAFDFVYGGGFTHLSEFQPILALILFGGIAWSGWAFRRYPRIVTIIAVAALLWIFVVSSEWKREIATYSAGVIFELVLAAVILYMAVSGRGWKHPELERPFGAFAGFFALISTISFAWRLRHDSDFLDWYREGKGGALMNDLEAVALDLHIHTRFNPGIEGLAGWLLLLATLPFPLALLWHLRRSSIHRLLRKLVGS